MRAVVADPRGVLDERERRLLREGGAPWAWLALERVGAWAVGLRARAAGAAALLALAAALAAAGEAAWAAAAAAAAALLAGASARVASLSDAADAIEAGGRPPAPLRRETLAAVAAHELLAEASAGYLVRRRRTPSGRARVTFADDLGLTVLARARAAAPGLRVRRVRRLRASALVECDAAAPELAALERALRACADGPATAGLQELRERLCRRCRARLGA